MLVMEYVPGSLRQTLRTSRLSVERTLRLAWDVTQALHYARNQLPAFVHADLKPENILIDADSTAKVTDLGLARAILRESGSGRPAADEGAGAGTPLYMAPEQFTGPAVPASDVYALACVLFEVLAGVPPYGVPDRRTSYRLQHLHGTPLPLATLRPDVPPALVDMIHAGLAKRPQDRPDLTDISDTIRSQAASLSLSLPEAEPAEPDLGIILEAMRGMVNIGLADDAIAAYERALVRLPAIENHELVRYLLVRALNDLKRSEEAEQHLAWLAGQEKDDDVWRASIIGEKGRAAYNAGRLKEALRLFAESVGIHPRASASWANLAAAAKSAGNPELAVLALQNAVLRSLNLAYLTDIVFLLIELGRPREALRYAHVAAKVHSTHLAARGTVYLAEQAVAEQPDGDVPAAPEDDLPDDLLDDLSGFRENMRQAVDFLLSDKFNE
ncbi:hypothetical protein TPA0908_58540 [Micromonospora sp. AKA38]|nr:hypothetical protein TPA0908_58540 [Micromonospora sp. AKA38]